MFPPPIPTTWRHKGDSRRRVGLPQGLARVLREKHWRYLHAPQVLVFPRYDLEEIRRAVVNRIVADNELFRGKEPENEESL